LYGASVVEKHFTLERAGPGLDDPIALAPPDFSLMVRRIREAEGLERSVALKAVEREFGAPRVTAVLGTGVKELAPSERVNYQRTNRSIHARVEIPRGAVISEDMLAILRTEKVLRPGLGPEFLSVVTGARAKRRIPAGEGIVWEDIL
jgi:sialic acid synthase SpsE